MPPASQSAQAPLAVIYTLTPTPPLAAPGAAFCPLAACGCAVGAAITAHPHGEGRRSGGHSAAFLLLSAGGVPDLGERPCSGRQQRWRPPANWSACRRFWTSSGNAKRATEQRGRRDPSTKRAEQARQPAKQASVRTTPDCAPWRRPPGPPRSAPDRVGVKPTCRSPQERSGRGTRGTSLPRLPARQGWRRPPRPGSRLSRRSRRRSAVPGRSSPRVWH
jgi:hypothetical protein